MHDHDRLDLVLAIGGKAGLDLLEVGAMAPVAGQKIDVELEFVGNPAPQHGKLPGLGHQHLVAGLQRIDDRRLPGAGTGRRIDDHRLLGAEHPLHRPQHRVSDFGEFGAPVVHGRHVHRAQHPVRHVGRSGNLQKMPSSMHGHGRPSRYCLGFARRSNITIWRACPPPGKGHRCTRSRASPCQAGPPQARDWGHSTRSEQ